MSQRKTKPAPLAQQCCIPGCTAKRWSAGRCQEHRRQLLREDPTEFQRLQSLSIEQKEYEYRRTKNPPPPPWEYENPEGEAYLARLCEQKEEMQL
jgi:hypothetical protein